MSVWCDMIDLDGEADGPISALSLHFLLVMRRRQDHGAGLRNSGRHIGAVTRRGGMGFNDVFPPLDP